MAKDYRTVKAKVITSGTGLVRRRRATDYDTENHGSDEESSLMMSPLRMDDFSPIDQTTIRVMEIQQQIRSSPPTWIVALQKTVAELTVRVVELQGKIHENESSSPVKIFNATIYDLDNVEYDLEIPVQAVVEEYEDETVARIPELNIFASSDTDTEALHLLKREIVELYNELDECSNLGPLPHSWLSTLNKLLKKRK